MSEPEYWLRGPVDHVPPLLQPVAHALLQAREDVTDALTRLTVAEIWMTPGRAASIGYHARHLCGSLDRLLTYARGETLSASQLADLKSEHDAGSPPADADRLVSLLNDAIERALAQVRATDEAAVHTPRAVGRLRLPSTTFGLLFHAAEHATRHAGQIVTTARIVVSR
jgi:uncharacterized damage-inducible protein DinB